MQPPVNSDFILYNTVCLQATQQQQCSLNVLLFQDNMGRLPPKKGKPFWISMKKEMMAW